VITSLLVGSLGGVLMAQDEAPLEQAVEVPEAGLAMSLPADWGVDIEMRQRQDFGLVDDPDAPPVVFWNVLYASAGGRPWCDVTWYPEHPLPMPDHAQLVGELMTPDITTERTVEMSSVELPTGEAYRFDIHNTPTATYSTIYLLGSGSSRYVLECAADTRDESDWLGVAQSVALAEVVAAEDPQP
jgi:hypothetical protein